MTKDEELKLSLDLAIMQHTDYVYAELRAKVRAAIKEALAQPEQDTVQRLSALVRAQQITIDKLEAKLKENT